MQLYQGELHHQCFNQYYESYDNELMTNNDTIWSSGEYFCHRLFTNNSNGCPDEYKWCLNIAPNPDAEVSNFDDFGSSLLQVFIVVTLEGWVTLMYRIQATGHIHSWVYFISLTFIVGFFAINLFLAVIEEVYSYEMSPKRYEKQSKRKKKKEQKQQKNNKIDDDNDSDNSNNDNKDNNDDDDDIKYSEHSYDHSSSDIIIESRLSDDDRPNLFNESRNIMTEYITLRSNDSAIVNPIHQTWLTFWRTGGLSEKDLKEKTANLNDQLSVCFCFFYVSKRVAA